MRLASLVTLLLVGCGPSAIHIAASCSAREATLEVETGIGGDCAALAAEVGIFRDTYEERWGHVDLTGWTIRLRSSLGRTGETWVSSGVLDVNADSLDLLPHEFRHAAGYSGHSGWCAEFQPWEQATLGVDERAYLGCP